MKFELFFQRRLKIYDFIVSEGFKTEGSFRRKAIIFQQKLFRLPPGSIEASDLENFHHLSSRYQSKRPTHLISFNFNP